MSVERSNRTTTTESLLGLLSMRPCSGYELKKLIGESIGNFWAESFGQIYPTLKRMVADGLAEILEEGGEGSRDRKVYRITDTGRERLHQWLGMPAHDQVPRNELLLKLFFGDGAEPGQMQTLVGTKRDEMAADLKRFEEIEAGMQMRYAGHPAMPYWRMTVRYGKAEAKAVMEWCNECLEAFKEMA